MVTRRKVRVRSGTNLNQRQNASDLTLWELVELGDGDVVQNFSSEKKEKDRGNQRNRSKKINPVQCFLIRTQSR
jgi:hypothetical protein